MHISTLLLQHPALSSCQNAILAASELMLDTYRTGNKILLCGNGGSAADCDHITGELLKGFLSRRPLSAADRIALEIANQDLDTDEKDPDAALLANQLQGSLPAISLPNQTALVSAFSNDADPTLVYAQLVWGLGQAGDLLVCLSTSGNSRNVILAAKAAKAKGMATLALTGEKPSILSDICDLTIHAPANETYRVQEYHLPIYHFLCAYVEAGMFGE